MSRSSSLRILVPSITSPVARALPARRIRGIRRSRNACPCGDVCTCRGRTRRPPGRTTCRSPCTGDAVAVALGALLHSPEWVLLPFDRADLVERRELIVGKVRPPRKSAVVRFREVHVQDIAAVDLPPARDAVHRDRDFLSLVRAFEGFLPAPDRLDAPESPTIRPHDGFPRTDSTGQHADAEDRWLRGPEHMLAEEEELRGVRDLLATRLGQLSLPLVPPRLIILDKTIDYVVLEQLEVRMFSESGLRVRENFQVEGEDRAVQRILRRRGIRDVPSRDRSEPGELDRDRSLLALVRESLEGTDRVRFHEDPFVLRLDVHLRFLRDLFDVGSEIALRRADRGARDGLLEPATDNLDARRGGDAPHRVEPLLRVPNLVQGLRLQEGLHLRRPRLGRGPEDDRVAFRERALIDDRVERDPEALLFLHLEDRADRRPFRGRELFLEEPLGEADESEQQVRDALAELRTDRDHGEVRPEVLDPIVSVGGESVLEQSTDEFVHAAVELLPRGFRLILVRADERLALVLPPSGHHVDLVRRDDERGLVPPEDVQALDRLRTESLVDVDDEDREVGERTAAGAQGREGHVARGIDEEEAGDTERSSLDEVPAHLEDCRKRDFCRADVLRDPAGLAAGHASAANPIEEGRLAMVHVPQDGHDGLANGGHRRRTKNPTLLNGWPPRSWARLLPQPRLVDPRVRVNLIRLEEQRDFAFRALGRVGTVDNVPANREGEVPADRSRFGLRGIGLAHHLSHSGDHAVSFEDHGDDGPCGDVVHQRLEERFSLVFRVVGLADGTTHADEFQRRDLQTAALESGEDFPDEAALHRVRL